MSTTGKRLAGGALIALMALGSILLWLVTPVGWIWIASQLSTSSQPSLALYGMLVVAIPATMVLVGRGLGRLNRLYGEVMGIHHDGKVVLPWHRSMRAERDAGHPRSVLDVVMVLSVTVALAALGVWFLFFASGGGI